MWGKFLFSFLWIFFRIWCRILNKSFAYYFQKLPSTVMQINNFWLKQLSWQKKMLNRQHQISLLFHVQLRHNVDFQNLQTGKHIPGFQIDKCALRQSNRLIKFKTAEPREVDLNPVASGDIFRLCLVSFRGLPVSHCRPLQFRFMEISTNSNLCQAWQTALMRSTSSLFVCVYKSVSRLSVVVIGASPRHCSSVCKAVRDFEKLIFVFSSARVCLPRRWRLWEGEQNALE